MLAIKPMHASPSTMSVGLCREIKGPRAKRSKLASVGPGGDGVKTPRVRWVNPGDDWPEPGSAFPMRMVKFPTNHEADGPDPAAGALESGAGEP